LNVYLECINSKFFFPTMKHDLIEWFRTRSFYMFYRIAAVLLVATVVLSGTAFAQMDEEPTSFTVTIENISDTGRVLESGVFNTPTDASEPGPALPGSAYEFNVHAEEGDYLTFATMLVQTNDLFLAPDEFGIAFYEMGSSEPVSGDVTDQILLWDAGTEVNEVPGEGANQAPRQEDPNTGEDENGVVQLVDDGFEYPAVSDLIEVTITPGDMGDFTVTVNNISGDSALPSPLAPGVWAVHQDPGVLFSSGQPDRGEGLEGLAEDGAAGPLGDALATILPTPFAPGVAVVHTDPGVLFTAGEADRGAGLEALAEDGDPSGLAELDYMGVNSVTVFNTPAGADEPGPLMPGGSYEFTVDAIPGDYLTFATMLVQSNDLFVAPDETGIAFFDMDGAPVEGEIFVALWDAGTEVNEAPGEGANQAPRQEGPDTGEDEGGVVQIVTDEFTYPTTYNLVRITITTDMMGE
jgi:hypothetical protein